MTQLPCCCCPSSGACRLVPALSAQTVPARYCSAHVAYMVPPPGFFSLTSLCRCLTSHLQGPDSGGARVRGQDECIINLLGLVVGDGKASVATAAMIDLEAPLHIARVQTTRHLVTFVALQKGTAYLGCLPQLCGLLAIRCCLSLCLQREVPQVVTHLRKQAGSSRRVSPSSCNSTLLRRRCAQLSIVMYCGA